MIDNLNATFAVLWLGNVFVQLREEEHVSDALNNLTKLIYLLVMNYQYYYAMYLIISNLLYANRYQNLRLLAFILIL